MRPLLVELRDRPPAHRYFYREGLGTADPRPANRWNAMMLLIKSGLVAGDATTEGVSEVRVRAEGLAALDPAPDYPLDVAIAQVRNGSPVDAIVTAVDGALANRLRAIAARHDVATTKANGDKTNLGKLNDSLRATGAYEEPDRTQVEAWTKLRNHLAHNSDATVSPARLINAIEGIRIFITEHPA